MLPAAADELPAPRPAVRRAVWTLSLCAAGMMAARDLPGLPLNLCLGAAGAGCVLAALTRGRACVLGLALGALMLGAAWMHARVHTVDALSLSAHAPHGERAARVLRVHGVVREAPRITARTLTLDLWLSRSAARRTPAVFSLSLRRAAAADGSAQSPVSGVLWVSVHPGALARHLRAGDEVELVGLWRAPSAPALPGRRDARLVAAQEGMVGWLIVHDTAPAIVRSPDSWTDAARATWYRVRAHLRAGALRALDGPPPGAQGEAEAPSERALQARALLRALLLGHYDPSIRPIADAWGRLGLLHALSISGFHIAVMAGMILVLVRLPGDAGRWESLIAGALVALYLVIIPAQAPVLRSGLMIGVVLLAEGLGRRYDRVNLLAWIAVALLIWRPVDVFDPGFQLSFALTAAIMSLGRPTTQWLLGPRGVRGRRVKTVGTLGSLARWVRGALASLVATSVLAWCIATPIVAYHFGVFSPLAIIASVLVVPVIVPTLWLGYAVIALGVLVPPLSAWCAGALTALGESLVWMTAWMDDLPGAGIMLPTVPLWPAAAGVGVAVWVFTVRDRRAARVWTGVGAVALAAALVLTHAWRSPAQPVVTPLAIEDGLCTLVTDGGTGVLVNVGTDRAGELSRLARDLPAAVRAAGGWRTPVVILTSARPSACSGLLEIIRPLGVERVVISPRLHTVWTQSRGTPFSMLLSMAEAQGVEVVAAHDGDRLTLPHGHLLPDPQTDGTMRVTLVRYGEGGAPAGSIEIPSSALPAK